MKKREFLDALGAGLSGSSDAEEVLDFYREMIEDRMEDGMERWSSWGPWRTFLPAASRG